MEKFKAGLDVGSTTAKIAIIDQNEKIIFSEYKRHNTKIHETIEQIFANAQKQLGNKEISITVTGSAGMGVSEKTGIPFVQEVVAATQLVKSHHPEIKTLIDIGGEDSKMIFFYDNKSPDIRMNGSCAGGTGAFIDQMASLLNVSLEEINQLAAKSTQIYPIASRCGVFAKTDVQNLISRKIPKEDIAASVFHAVAVQVMNTLARGFDIEKKVMFAGGPFTFLPELEKSFIKDLNILKEDAVRPENPALLPALGAAIDTGKRLEITLEELKNKIKNTSVSNDKPKGRLTPLFKEEKEFEDWSKRRIKTKVPTTSLENYKSNEAFLGIDSGSTTTKITITGVEDELLFKYYINNNGNPIDAVKDGLQIFKDELKKSGKEIKIIQSAVTGYGEDLIKAALGLDIGIVETIAHYTAARHFNPKVSFIMDIGGQDMKAIFIDDGILNRIELNEACSSGCGSFIETFGKSLGYQVADFAQMACHAKAPADLGTRCTVFMNSKVKQSLRENAKTEDIAAGLSISVIKNALFKVLKLKNISELGEHIVVQGGTFRNPSVHRALEVLAEKEVICTDIPELMGAYGAALIAKVEYNKTKEKTTFVGLQDLDKIDNYKTKQLHCKGCENICAITKFTFDNKNIFYSGNKCENIFSNKGSYKEKGTSLFKYKNQLLFDRNTKPTSNSNGIRIGIPRVLNMYENYPFWNTLLTNCGMEVVLSEPSTMKLYEKGQGTVMSDSICFPAKLVHGHVMQLAEKKVSRIFYPMVIFEGSEYEGEDNTFNCPIVSSYPDVIRSAINTEKKHNIPFDSPTFNLANEKLLKKACYQYVKQFKINKRLFVKAFNQALEEQKSFKTKIKEKGLEIIKQSEEKNQMLVVLAGRPYHADPLINHKTPEILNDLGVNVISEDAVPTCTDANMSNLHILPQWSYPNRIYNAAQWISQKSDNFQFVQFNSFGCGPDAIAVDESIDILKEFNKNHTLIRIDEITSTGSVRLRLRSTIESLKLRDQNRSLKRKKRVTTAIFTEEEKHRTILAPQFSGVYSKFLPSLFKLAGYKLQNLPNPNKESVQYGLKYSNNEVCYPATIIVGDIIKALETGNYNRNEIAIGITQTGGQCRASTYISLIKKGMVAAGFADVPVISVGTGGGTFNSQPGFNIPWKKMISTTFNAILYADSVAKMFYSSVVREKKKGQSQELLDRYIRDSFQYIEQNKPAALFDLLKKAVEEFNSIDIDTTKEYPKIGIVGEIYVKYNSFGNNNIVNWLLSQGIEVVVPPILDFFTQSFVNIDANKKGNIIPRKFTDFMVYFYEQFANRFIRKAEKIMCKFRFHSPFHKLRDMSKKAEKVLSLVNQFGEGWLIPAEIASFADEGIYNVVSLQPFGCIANHVISKGIEKRIKDLYPNMNLLFLDYDDGTTEVNILNRLHFMVKNVREQDACEVR